MLDLEAKSVAELEIVLENINLSAHFYIDSIESCVP